MSLKKHIPNFITSLNLLCGTLGVIAAFKCRFDQAFFLMLAASLFDFCDGLAARTLDAYSDLGKELDSISDVVSFGVLPSMMLVNLMSATNFSTSIWDFVPVVLAVFSGIRLAKFNVDERQIHSFLGLPTPVSALICGSLCCFISYEPASFLALWALGDIFIPVLAVVLSALLISEIPMFSFKFSRDDDKIVRRKRLAFIINVAIIVAIVASCSMNWSMIILLSLVVYVVMNIVFALLKI